MDLTPKLLFLSCMLLSVPLRAEAAAVRFMVSEALAMPVGEIVATPRGRELRGGILLEWQEALAQTLNRRPVYVLSSRKRQDELVAQGGVDVRCFSSPDWISNGPQHYHWPKPFMVIEERLVGPDTEPLITSLAQLEGKTIGTVLGYHYPQLQALFEQGRARRDDAPNESLAFKKLLLRRSQYAVMRTLNLAYQQTLLPAARTLRASPLPLTETPIYCALPKNGQVSLPEFQAAQAQLIASGVLENILKRYRLTAQ